MGLASPKNYLYFWDTYTLYATVQPAGEMHTQTTASITLSLDGAFSLEARGDESAREFRAVFVPPGVEHRVTTPGVRRVVIQLEPGSPFYYSLGDLLESDRVRPLEITELHVNYTELCEALAPAFRGRVACEAAHAMFFQILRAVAGAAAVAASERLARGGLRDERIARVLDDLRNMEELPAGLSAAELAASVDLSTERFRRLFKSEMGLTVRRYLLWLRIRRAGAAVTTGVSLTEAAHAVGFYDSAHLSRSCKEFLGFPPSFLTGQAVEMVNCAAGPGAAGLA
ncbi:MAG: helix-turn-helix transcriptional regulator [bacterium]|nr:helix-turn-helix transcriptional regulator [bacterium]